MTLLHTILNVRSSEESIRSTDSGSWMAIRRSGNSVVLKIIKGDRFVGDSVANILNLDSIVLPDYYHDCTK